jgi:2-polyprenyl-3-methyl-5-hydroxy-6-metoxy-1,4-benzoquinol methylase
MAPMDRLGDRDELLDGPLDDPVTLAANLRDLRRINRLLGGVELSRRAFDALVGDRMGPISLLDVGTGAGDIPAALQVMEARRGRQLLVTALDSRPEVVAAALAGAPELASLVGFRFAVGDGRRLAEADCSHDVVHASLVLHHLAPDQALLLLREMGRVAAVGVIVNDLARGWLAWLGAWLLGHALTRNRLTRHDAPLSVRRAYRPAEVQALLATAGLRPIATMGGLFGHRYAIAAVPEAAR